MGKSGLPGEMLMRIIKRDIGGVLEFKCRYCETIFEADESEYVVRRFVESVKESGFFLFSKAKLVNTFSASCLCPVCKEQVWKELPKITEGE